MALYDQCHKSKATLAVDSRDELGHTYVVLIADHRLSDGADGSNPGPQRLGARTRDRVRQTIAEDGPLTAAALASRLGLTPAAVRRHLDLLAEQGAIEERQPASAGGSGRGRGRPARAYILSEAGHAGMDSDYDDVATSALRFLAEHAGADAVDAFARERNAELEARYAVQLAATGQVRHRPRAGTGDGIDRRRFRRFHPTRGSGHAPGRCAAVPGALPGSARRSPVPGVL